jgi:hypothetical protein
MLPSIKPKSEKAARNEAIAGAFDSIREAYSGYWIEVADWFRIICAEYDLIPATIDFTDTDLRSVIKVRFNLATFEVCHHDVYFDKFRKKGEPIAYCYFVQGSVTEHRSSAIQSVYRPSNPLMKILCIEELIKKKLTKILSKTDAVGENDAGVKEKTSRNVINSKDD